jgi:hypothetical protein
VRLAARGARETADGRVAAIEDPEEVRQLERQARRVYGESLAIALLVTGLTMLARGLLAT